MHYKKWIILLFAVSTLMYGSIFLLYLVVDPEQIFNKSITKYKFGYTKYYSKHQYEKLKSHKYILIFGTSRSQALSSKELGEPLLNFHNIYGEPGDILNFLKQLDKQQIQNTKHIYYLVSLDTMRNDINLLDYSVYTIWDEVAEAFPLGNLSLKYLMRDIINNIRRKSIYYYVDDDGSQFIYDKNKTTVLNRTVKQSFNINLKKSKSIETLLKIDTFCKKVGIKITYYTPTYTNKYTLQKEQLFFMWKQLLQGGIDGFYALYYLNGTSNEVIGKRYTKFLDASHLNYYNMNKVFKNIVLDEDSKYKIKDEQTLVEYFNKMKEVK